MTAGECCNRLVVIARRDERVAEAARRLRDVHVGTLPGLNDSEEELREMAAFVRPVGPEVPWHVWQFYQRAHALFWVRHGRHRALWFRGSREPSQGRTMSRL
jgi:pyruvate-formate lyase-activating enzyme